MAICILLKWISNLFKSLSFTRMVELKEEKEVISCEMMILDNA